MIAVGVDTHKEQHLGVALDGLGQVLAEIVITTTLAGYSEFVCWLKDLGENVLVGIEGAGSYGAGLCEFLQAEEVEVFEVERPQRRERRTGKSDRLDALLAAKKVLTREGLSTPRGSGKRLALQMQLVGHRSAVSERSRLYNQAASAPGRRTIRPEGTNRPRSQWRNSRQSPLGDAHTTDREPAREHHPAGAPRPC